MDRQGDKGLMLVQRKHAFNICNSRLFTFVTVRQPSNVKMVINVTKITNIKRITKIVCDTQTKVTLRCDEAITRVSSEYILRL